jgi:DNA-binding NarL/FixJ family response regulator
MINVLIADAHPVARAGLHLLVEHIVERLGDECMIAFSDDALTAFRKAKRLQPDLILLSASLPLSGGVQAVLALRHYTPGAKLVILGEDQADAVLQLYLDAGAHSVMRKGESKGRLEENIGKVLRGDTSARAARQVTPSASAPSATASTVDKGTPTKKIVPRPGFDSQRKS